MEPSDLSTVIRQRALALGFDRVGIASAATPVEDPERPAGWIAAGMHGAMEYLARDPRRRADPRALLPSALSLVAVAARYPEAQSGDAIAAYARLEDYHRRIREGLTELLAFVRERAGSEVDGVACVDTKPLLERAAAARAGLGWIGKNTMLLSERDGPWLMLGVLLLSIELAPDAPAEPRCGTCTRCLEACPTGAFVAPYVLDARRCLSYWTIEHRGPWPREFREKVGGRVFGCDDCLTSCPFPRRRDGSGAGLLPVAPELAALDPREVLRRCEESFTRHFKRFAIERAGKAGLVRNALTALGNVGGAADAALVARYLDHPDRGVRIHAAWALGRLKSESERGNLERALDSERDAEVREEIAAALAATEPQASPRGGAPCP